MAALQLLEAGRFADAEQTCRAILAAAPADVDARHALALAIQRQGRVDEAVEMLQAVRAEQPKNPHAAYNLAVALQEAGRNEDAISAYRHALKLDPKDADAYYNLGAALRATGLLEQAVQAYRKAVAIAPHLSKAHNNLGNALRDLGNTGAAFESYRHAVTHDPDNTQAHVNLAVAAHHLGDDIAATRHFDIAERRAANDHDARQGLANGLIETRRVQRAIALLVDHLTNAEENDAGWDALFTCLLAQAPERCTAPTSAVLLGLIDHPRVAPLDIAPALAAYLKREPPVAELLQGAITDLQDGAIACRAAAALSGLPLLLKTMAMTPIPDRDLEALFAAWRTGLLSSVAGGTAAGDALPFACALALQAFTNEYVYPVDADEIAAAEDLLQRDPNPMAVAVVGTYMPLSSLGLEITSFDAFRDGPLGAVIRRQLDEPAREAMLAAAIPQLTTIDDDVSGAVRAQYEANPYPRWIKAARPRGGGSVHAMLAAPPFGFDVRGSDPGAAPRILIAGCGTGQHAMMVAAKFPAAEILAVDLSRASLAYARRMADELGADNVRFSQADILSLDTLEQRFDVIESVGVLHHMADPGLGWRRLTALLAPAGIMKIGLYSAHARQAVAAVSRRLKDAGFSGETDSLRRARTYVLKAADGGDAEMAAVTEASDFYSLSEVRDLLFHVQEHRMTLPDIKGLIDELGLHFLGFEIRDPDINDAFAKMFPSPRARRSLSDWNSFERRHPWAFREMYQFWCQKK